ncbi:hypothetical protein [Streptomyces montanisoli]|uniref:Uncharacterized protein n=1 Tax=Streptomyces montanisoli TaxID=2798581 RepID=A0A940ME38_9ACTN|nr:hypothetical protein [Streptomyces montanisoli]MBP0457902.1 hypothetical protein [Streptomyces montanisoli]
MADDGEGHGGFEAATGYGPARAETVPGGRAAEVRVAYEGLLQIRRLTHAGPGDPAAVPASWERLRPVRAVALALEAAGIAPSAVDGAGARTATGYAVREGDGTGTARVEWLGPAGSGASLDEEAALTRCAAALERLGWEALMYRGPRRRRHLEVEPAR